MKKIKVDDSRFTYDHCKECQRLTILLMTAPTERKRRAREAMLENHLMVAHPLDEQHKIIMPADPSLAEDQ